MDIIIEYVEGTIDEQKLRDILEPLGYLVTFNEVPNDFYTDGDENE